MFSKDDVIQELEHHLYEAKVNVAALERTIEIVKSLGEGKREPPEPEIIPVATESIQESPPPKKKYGDATRAVKEAVKLCAVQFTRKDVEKHLIGELSAVRVSGILGGLVKQDLLTLIKEGVGATLGVYGKINAELADAKDNSATAEPDTVRVVRNEPSGFQCNNCGEISPSCPQECENCGQSSFEDLD